MLNLIIIQGRLTKDPEFKQIPSGTHLVAMTIASERPSKKGEEKVTDFINAIAWARTADFISQYFKKGDMIIVSGRMQSRAYETTDGSRHMAYEISISEANFAGTAVKRDQPVKKTSIQEDYDSINWDDVPNLPSDF